MNKNYSKKAEKVLRLQNRRPLKKRKGARTRVHVNAMVLRNVEKRTREEPCWGGKWGNAPLGGERGKENRQCDSHLLIREKWGIYVWSLCRRVVKVSASTV